jgi:phospholipase/lecithinase/hemolysin
VLINFPVALVGASLTFVAIGTLPANAANLDYSSLYSFGDSLADSGNSLAVSGFPPSPFYFQGRFSNGPNWVEYLSQDLGLSPSISATLPSNSPFPNDGVNFAFGGATSGTYNLGKQFFPDLELLGLTQQVDGFINQLGSGPADPNALYTISAGSNDYIRFFTSSPSLLEIVIQPAITVRNLSNSISKLANAGAEDIVVFNLPNLGDTPVGSSTLPGALNLLTSAHNSLLSLEVRRLRRSLPNTNILLFNTNRLFKDARSNPQQFGLSNVTDNCADIDFPNLNPSDDIPTLETCLSRLAQDPKAFLFYDNQHPTSAAHEIIADSLLGTLQSSFGSSTSTASLSLASSLTRESDPVPVPEPAAVPAIALLGLWMLKRQSTTND